MAIIYSYPLVTSIQPSDLLILSVDSSELPTRQVTVGDLLASGAVDVNLNFTADTGTGSVNLSTQSLEVRQGVYVTTTATNQELIINHKSTVRQDTNIGDTSPGYGGSFTVIDSVVTDATGSGHVTGVNLKTVTLPSADDTNTTYDLLGYNTGIELVGSDNTRDQIQIVGSGDTTVSQANNIITVSSTSGAGGSGTTNTLAKWTGPTTLGDSIVSDFGTSLTIAGNTVITNDVQISTLASNYIPVNNNSGVLRDSGFYQVPSSVSFTGNAIGLNTTLLDSFYGEYPDLRVASRSLNDPGVLDLFRPDGDVQPGDRVGILQYSLNDDTQYAVAQIEVKTIGQAGTGNTGGGKLCIKTSSNQAGAQVTERLCIDNTEADFSVPINVTDLNRSSFAGQVTIPLTPVANTDAASKGYVDSQTDNYVDGGSYSSATGILTLSRTGGLANVTASGFLQVGTTSATALAGNTTTITQTQADDIIANNAKVSFPEAPTDGQQYARQNSSWSVVSGGGGGSVTGDGNQYNIPVWNGTTELSGITSNAVANKLLSGITTSYITASTGSDVPTEHVIKNYNSTGSSSSTLTYTQAGVLRFSGGQGGRIDVGLNAANISNADLNVGTGVATFKGGVIISNSPGGVQVDNSSLVIGSGTNDNISGSDHCLIVGSGNQITSNSDQSVAFGQGNAITSSVDAFAVGNSNTLTSSLRTQALGFNNTITASSSFVAGGGNSITASSNIFALGDGHTVTTTGSTQDAYLLGTGNTITGGTGSFAIGSNLDGDTGNHMVVGYRNDKTSYPTTNYSLGLGNTKFALAVGSTTTTNSNALLITEGGVNRGGGVAQVPRVLLPTVTGFSASNDAAADALGVPQGALYQNQGVVQINRGGGSTTDPLAGGGGGGGIAGSLADEQVAFGNGTDTVAGSGDFTWNGNTLALGGSTGNGNLSAVLITGDAMNCNANLNLGTVIQHQGDSNTKFGFPINDTFTIETNGSERMRVNNDGRIGIGVSTIISAQLDVKTTSTSAPALRLNMPGTSSSQNGLLIESNGSSATLQKFTQGISTRGSITFSGIGGVAYNTSSDYRIKENVTAIADGIERVKQLKPSKFNFIGSEQVVDGFIAHEVQSVIPEAIHGEKDATEEYEISPEVLDEEGNVLEEAVIGTKDKLQGIDQSKIVPLLTAALQEAIEKIETLEARVQALES